jgi:tetratricopeptide (TPR) repeat protein
MKLRRQTSLVASAVLIAALAAAVLMVGPLQRAQGAEGESDQAVLYIPSAKAIKRMSLGYSGLAADIYWTRAVQYFGKRHQERSRSYPLLFPLLDVTTDLDPKLTVAYQFGSTFLAPPAPGGGGQPDKAVELVEKGIKTDPDNWRLYLSLGFIQYQYRHDVTAGIAAFERGSQVPNAHPSLRILAAALAQQGGDERKATILWHAIYDTTTDKLIKKNALDHLTALEADAQVTQLQALVENFQQRTGRLPSNFAEMAAAGWLRGIPVDPAGEPFVLTPEGRVEVSKPWFLPFITKGLPPGTESRKGLELLY